ncbi:MAG TPA: type II secretion system F family protein [Planctomycetota bacterium]|nr:type II secretion system F family protein [Planctomycetota bacterium]
MMPVACPLAPPAFIHPYTTVVVTDGLLALLKVLLWVFVTVVVPYVVYRLMSLPLRRQERARLFLDVLESAVARGKSAEEALVSLAAIEPLGVLARFGWLGALLFRWPYHLFCGVFGIRRDEVVFGRGVRNVGERLMNGVPLHEAVEPRDNLLPAQVIATLRVGGEVGDLTKVLPACRQVLADAASRTRAAMNYLALMLIGASFLALPVLAWMSLRVTPLFEEMMGDMRFSMPPVFGLLRGPGDYPWVFLAMLAVAAVLFVGALLYMGGPRLVRALRLGPAAGWLQYHLPWRRKRLQRDFSAMLAILLDAGAPEPDAVAKAAQSTANPLLLRRATRATLAMKRGDPLTEAVARLDDSGEFRWRLANAAHVGTGFAEALAGWQQSLDARAFQQEQAAAHVITSAITLVNGLVVALVALGVFQCLMTVINACLPW